MVASMRSDDDVLAPDLERGQAAPLDERGREDVPDEDGREEEPGEAGTAGDEDGGVVPAVLREGPADQEGGDQEDDGLEVPRGEPELRGEVGGIPGEDPHPLVREGVEEVEASDEEERDPDEQEEGVGEDGPGIPDEEEDGERHGDAGDLDDAVEEEVVDPGEQDEPGQHGSSGRPGDEPGGGAESHGGTAIGRRHGYVHSGFGGLIQKRCGQSRAPAHAAGRVKKKVEPSPGVDSTRICPPCRSMILLTIARPMPVPG